MDSIRSLRKAIKKNSKDTFEIGTVIRWTAAGRYTYAVIKTAVGWYTTASYSNGFVSKQMEYDELVETLSRSEASDVMVATEWVSLDD